MGGSRVFAAGRGGRAAGFLDFLVRAYDAKTGDLLWERQFDVAGGEDEANGIAVHGSRVFAVGFGGEPGQDEDFLVRAYNAQTGDLLWGDQFDLTGSDDEARAVAVGGSGVFAVGFGIAANGKLDFLVRAYDAQTGDVLWQDQFDKAGNSDQALNVTVGGGKVFAVGVGETAGNDGDFVVRAYDAK